MTDLQETPQTGASLPRGGATTLRAVPLDDRVVQGRVVPGGLDAGRSELTGDRRRRFGTAVATVTSDVVGLIAAIVLFGEVKLPTVLVASCAIGLLGVGGLYRHRITLSVLDDLPAIVGRLLVVAAVGATFRQLLSNDVEFASRIRLAAGAIVLVLAGRTVVYSLQRKIRARGLISYRTLVLGAGRTGHDLATLIGDHPECGLSAVGFYDPDPLPIRARTLPVFGADTDLAEIIEQLSVAVVVVAYSSVNSKMLVDLLRACDRLDCEIFLVPRLYELSAPLSRQAEHIWSMPLVRLNRAPYRSLGWRVKRLIDIAGAGIGLLLLAPILAAIALLVRLDGGPGVLFRQERISKDNRRFTIYKFRTLRPVDTNESATKWNIRHDDRLRPIGKFLRSTSLDELPQLWNVLRGDMSIVGPRPERPHFVGQFSEEYPRYRARHRVPCGLTGWAQVQGLRGDTSIEERARFDNHYIDTWSLWNDVKIMLRTATALLARRGGG